MSVFQIPEGTFGTEKMTWADYHIFEVSNPGRNVWDPEPAKAGPSSLQVFQIPEGTFGTEALGQSFFCARIVSNPGRNVWDPKRSMRSPFASSTSFKSRKERLGHAQSQHTTENEGRVSNPGRNVWDDRSPVRRGPRGQVSNPGRNVWDPRRSSAWPAMWPGFKSRKERLGLPRDDCCLPRAAEVSNPGRNVWDD